jgi:hypothetical protein
MPSSLREPSDDAPAWFDGPLVAVASIAGLVIEANGDTADGPLTTGTLFGEDDWFIVWRPYAVPSTTTGVMATDDTRGDAIVSLTNERSTSPSW